MTRLTRWIAIASVAALALYEFAAADPGGHSMTEDQHFSRKLFVENGRNLLKNCVDSEAGRLLQEKAVVRRLAMLDTHTKHRRLDADTALATNHQSSRTGLLNTTDPSELFDNTSACLLEPEVTEGLYYVSRELIRSDIREDEPGIDPYVDLQFIDVSTCTPVNNLYVDFWHANTSGVYSGVVARTNGNSDDATNVDTTFLRGLSPTDSDGFVSFTTKFPGLYTGRATHIHIMTHYEGTVNNRTYSDGRISHVGQLFFDQDLITEVQSTGVYTENSNRITSNSDDSILLQSAADSFDPFVEYAPLGDSIEDGLLSWISVGVDMTNDESVSAAGTYTGGGAATSNNAGNDGVKLGRFCSQVFAIVLMTMNVLLL